MATFGVVPCKVFNIWNIFREFGSHDKNIVSLRYYVTELSLKKCTLLMPSERVFATRVTDVSKLAVFVSQPIKRQHLKVDAALELPELHKLHEAVIPHVSAEMCSENLEPVKTFWKNNVNNLHRIWNRNQKILISRYGYWL